MQRTDKTPHFVILGAGITGLSLAWFLKQRFGDKVHLTILEKQSHAGGYLKTRVKEGFLFEEGPHAMRVSDQDLPLLRLVQGLDLEKKLIETSPSAHYRYLWLDQNLTQLPMNLMEALKNPLTRGMVLKLIKGMFSKERYDSEETIYDFFLKRCGVQATETLVDALTTGIYAGDIRKLSLSSCYPLLHQWETTQGSLLKGWLFSKKRNTRLLSFPQGLGTLTNALVTSLESHLLCSTTAKALHFHKKGIDVITESGRVFEADHLFSTLPSERLSTLVEPHHKQLSEQLNAIPLASLVSVHCGFCSQVLPYQGFGYLVPYHPLENVLGMTWDSSIFPQQNQSPNETRLTILLGGAHYPEVLRMKPDEIQLIARNALQKHLNIAAKPDILDIQLLPNAIPQYHVGHSHLVRSILKNANALSPYLTCISSSFNGVSICDCVASAAKTVENMEK